MEKFVYSRNGKVFIFILQLLAVATAVIAGAVLCLYTVINVKDINEGTIRYRINWLDSVATYEDSDYFHSMLTNQVSETIRYAVIQNQMEVEGVFDGKKEIDIEEYFKRYNLVQEEHESASYYIEDLIKWGQYGVEYTNKENGYASDLYTEMLQEVEPAKDVEITDYSLNEEPEALTSKSQLMEIQKVVQHTTTDGWELVERYQTIEGKHLSDYVTDEMTYDDLCKYLENTAKSLAYNYTQYKNYNKLFQDSKTNLSYHITLENKEGMRTVYTNMEVEDEESAKKIVENMGQYINYDAVSLSYKTNTPIMEEDLVREINYYDYTYSGNSQFLIGIDTRYLYEDKFLEGYNAYRTIVPKIPYLLIVILIDFLLVIGLFLLSVVGTGKEEKGKGCILHLFDRIKTEVFLGIGAGIGIGFLYLVEMVLAEVYYFEVNKKMICIGLGVVAILVYALFLAFFLSFARRVKANSLWKDSLVRTVLLFLKVILTKLFIATKKTVGHVYKDTTVTMRTWFPYLIFLLGNLILCLLGLPGILIAVVFDLGIGIYQFKENKAREKIVTGIEYISEGDLTYKVDSKGMHGDNLILAESVNMLGDGIRKAVETSMKDERLKADLITNVSHDIKTPLTSIINYVDLIKRENIQDERINNYIEILDAKSQRLKHLTEDLVEASKISSGNITLIMEKINFVELMNQSIGEFLEKFEARGISLITNIPEHPVIIEADSRRIWRVIENLGNNISKYAMENSRVYVDMRVLQKEDGQYVVMSLKNISQNPLNIDASELTERFIRGDVSRSTEGSGLGLSIAKNLTELQKGKFEVYLDGDLFKVSLEFLMIE